MDFRPQRFHGTLIGLIGLLLVLVPTALVARRLALTPLSFSSFGWAMLLLLLVTIAGALAYRVYSCWTLRYRIDRNCLSIRHGITEWLIPLAQVHHLVQGRELLDVLRRARVCWTGYRVGWGRVESLGETMFCAACRSQQEMVYVLTANRTYGLSVPDPERFVSELRFRQSMGPTRQLTAATRQWALAELSIWRNPVAAMLALIGLMLSLSLLGYACWAYPGLPAVVPLRFNAEGEVLEVGRRLEVLRLPLIALGLVLTDWVLAAWIHQKEKLLAHICLLGGIWVQALFWVATARIVG